MDGQSNTGLPKEGFEHAPAKSEAMIAADKAKSKKPAVAGQSSNGGQTMDPRATEILTELERLTISGKFIQDSSGFVFPVENYEFNVFTDDGSGKVPSNVLVVARQGKPYQTIRVFDNPECEGEPMYVMTQEVFNHWNTPCTFALNRNDAYHTADGNELHLIMSMSGDVYFDDIMQK